MSILDLREHTGKDFQAHIFFVTQTVRAPLQHPDLLVEIFEEPHRHFVLPVTIPYNHPSVEGSVYLAANTVARFFPRRTRPMTRALGPPNTPRTLALGRKPGKQYVSDRFRDFPTHQSCHVFSQRKSQQTLVQSHFPTISSSFLPTRSGEDP